ncbi:MAG: sulfatase [Planctomycetota bacterium]
MNRILFVCCAALLLGTFSAGRASGDDAPPNRRNVLMIAVDDLRPELNCYGVQKIQTPNIDRLAQSGMRFNRAYCQVAVCGASRASLLSGCRPETTTIWDYKTPLRSKLPDILSLPQHFKNQGYDTAFLGKVYHNASDDKASWTVSAEDWAPRQQDRGKGYVKTPYWKRKTVPGMGNLKHGPSTENGGDVSDHAYVDGHNAERAVAMLGRFAKNEKPFFFAVGFIKPHLPFVAPQKYWDLYQRDSFEVPDRAAMRDSVPWARSTWGELKNYPDIGRDKMQLDDATTRRLIHGYYAATSYMDAQVGKLLDALEANGLAESTTVVLWGDHGWYLGDFGAWCKHTNHEVATRVPFLVRPAPSLQASLGFDPGKETNAMVELVDLYPTLCELSGFELPDHLHGDSVVPLLSDPDRPWAEAAFSQYRRTEPAGYAGLSPQPKTATPKNAKPKNNRRRGIPNIGTSVRTRDFRYTVWKRQIDGSVSAEELVDFRTDPGATRNVIADPRYADNLDRLRELATRSATGVRPPLVAAPQQKPAAKRRQAAGAAPVTP